MAAIILKNGNIHTKVIEGKSFLIDLDSAVVLELNEVGGFIWSALGQTQQLDHLLAGVTKAFEVSQAQAKKDMAKFLQELKRCGAISLEGT